MLERSKSLPHLYHQHGSQSQPYPAIWFAQRASNYQSLQPGVKKVLQQETFSWHHQIDSLQHTLANFTEQVHNEKKPNMGQEHLPATSICKVSSLHLIRPLQPSTDPLTKFSPLNPGVLCSYSHTPHATLHKQSPERPETHPCTAGVAEVPAGSPMLRSICKRLNMASKIWYT